jgi:hypothetical protein
MDADEAFDVILNLTSEVSFHDIFGLENSVNPCNIILGKLMGSHVRI